jgi:hypothetical protein
MALNTHEAAAMVSTAIASAVGMTAQGVQAVAAASPDVVALGPSVILSLVSGVLAGGVSFGLLKGRVENAQKRADDSHARHDKTDEKIDKILARVSDTREMVAGLVGAEKANERRRAEDDE